jgi:hypothetical protein
VDSVDISDADDKDRQLLTLVHELLHVHAHPNKPNHRDLHTLAAGLAKHIFPRHAEKGNTMFDATEEAALASLISGDFYDEDELFDVMVNDDDFMSMLEDAYDDDDDNFFGDEDDYDLFRRRKKKGLAGFFQKFKEKALPVLLPGVGSLIAKKERQKRRKHAARSRDRADAAAKERIAAVQPATGSMKDIQDWGGWLMPALQQAYSGQALLVPRRGIVRAAPDHNINGWKASSWASFWAQMIQSLESGNNRTFKEFARATAVGGVATTVAFATARSIGALVRLSDSITNADNASVRVAHFTQVGATPLPYILDVSLDRGVAEYLVINAENDRGGGVPTSREDHQITVAADGMRAGMVMSIESVNLRELQA